MNENKGNDMKEGAYTLLHDTASHKQCLYKLQNRSCIVY